MRSTRISVCPHDCPSACSLSVTLDEMGALATLRGEKRQTYTDGVICNKVSRYAERQRHKDRLTRPLVRVGPKGSGQFREISWDEALDRAAEGLLAAERRGSERIWPYFYAGTMGLVMRDGIERLRHVKRYSRQYSTICTALAWAGYIAGTGRLGGADPREIAKSDCVVIWGTNPVHTQVNVMTHAVKARKERGAKIVAVDVYMNETMRQADVPVLIRPGTDAALACAIMHVLFREGLADRAYLARYTDDPAGFEAHLSSRTPQWAEAICGYPAGEIEALARLLGRRPRAFFRLGYGFSRQRNGAVAMHAALSIPAVLGAWQYEGGGAFHSNSGIFRLDKTLIEGLDRRDSAIRALDQSQIGRILTGDAEALRGGPPVDALFIQNTNPLAVAPEQGLVRRGFAREDLFTIVHEQFLTDTAMMADLVLPATMFLEHDDLYQGGGHQHLMFGPKVIEPPGQARSNHEVVAGLAARLGADHPGFAMSARDLIDATLRASGRGTLAELEAEGFRDVQPPFETAHYLDGFAHQDGTFHFRPDWLATPVAHDGPKGPVAALPVFPDQFEVTEAADETHPFRLVTAPARSFLNSTFTEIASGRVREGKPSLLVHSEDAARLGLEGGAMVLVGNGRGQVMLETRIFDGLRRGVVIAESVHPVRDHVGGWGINALTGADQPAPFGGAAFHDTRVWLRRPDMTPETAGL